MAQSKCAAAPRAAAPAAPPTAPSHGGSPTYPARYPYKHSTYLWDSNGSCSCTYLCTAVTGYDGPTGVGTPHTSAGFKY